MQKCISASFFKKSFDLHDGRQKNIDHLTTFIKGFYTNLMFYLFTHSIFTQLLSSTIKVAIIIAI